MKIFIPTYNKSKTHSTYFILKDMGIKSTLVFHTEEMMREYVGNGTPEEDCLCLNAPLGLAHNRNAILDYCDDDWHMQMSDDATGFFKVDDSLYSQEYINVKENPLFYKEKYNIPVSGQRLLDIFEETKKEADRVGAKYAGFAITSNHFFREKKFMYSGLVDGRCILIKKSDIRYDVEINSIDDYQFTAENLLRVGLILRNNYLLPEFVRYGEGGIGTEKNRFQRKNADCDRVMNNYPDMFRKIYQPEKSRVDLKFKKFNLKSIENWRKRLLFNK